VRTRDRSIYEASSLLLQWYSLSGDGVVAGSPVKRYKSLALVNYGLKGIEITRPLCRVVSGCLCRYYGTELFPLAESLAIRQQSRVDDVFQRNAAK